MMATIRNTAAALVSAVVGGNSTYVPTSTGPALVEQVKDEVTLTFSQIFTPTGVFLLNYIFRYNVVSVRNLINRRYALRVLAGISQAEFMSQPFPARKAAFTFLKQETARYYGTFVRADGSKAPQLKFQDKRDAAAYRELLQRASRNIAGHVNASKQAPTATA